MKKPKVIDIKEAIMGWVRRQLSSYKIIFAIFLLLIGVIALLTYLSIRRERAEMIDAAIREKRTLNEVVALSVASAETYTVSDKRQIVREVTQPRGILYCRVVKPTGEIYLSNISEDLGTFIEDPDVLTGRTVVKDDVYDGRRIKVIVSPAAIGYTVWLGFSLDEVEAAVRRMILTTIGIAACIDIACIVVYYGLTTINQRLMAANLVLQEAYRGLKDGQAQLIQADKLAAIGQLTAGIAHELNNPLTSVLGYAQLLQAAKLDEQARADLDKIVGGAERAARIVRSLLTFARQQKPERRLIEINDIILSILDLRAYHLKMENIEVIKELAHDLPLTVADPSQLSQVFLNLVNNAEQAMVEAHGRGTLTVRSELVNGGVIRVEIANDGSVISPEIIARIFDPFFTTKEVGQGTGLGLSICYGIIQEHGGRIWAESSTTQGVSFFVELPVIKGSQFKAEASVPTEQQPTAGGKRILVVEDEESIELLLRRVLEEKGHQIATATSGEEALEMIAGSEYDLIISDLKMPGMGGFQFYESLMVTHPKLGPRMVFITGDMANPETKEFLVKTGNPYLSKPFSLTNVEEIVDKVLSE